MTVRILQGDCRDVLRTLPEKSVHCVVTSPPYLGLRDYGTASWEGGNETCNHIADPNKTKQFGNPEFNVNRPSRADTKTTGYYYRDTCGKCGAIRIDRQIGLEATLEDYVASLVTVFREVRRVLRNDGLAFLNLGDSFASGCMTGKQGPNSRAAKGSGQAHIALPPRRPYGLLKQKDIMGVPWAVAFALRDDGWWLRQDIIWARQNPVPESVKDRFTKSHEYIFMLAKSQDYFFDQQAVAEPATHAGKVVTLGDKSLSKGQANGAKVAMSGNANKDNVVVVETRNKRDVWNIPVRPFEESHYATFPPDLVVPMILAGCPPKVCASCGAPWFPKVNRIDVGNSASSIKYAEQRITATGGAISGGTKKSTLNGPHGLRIVEKYEKSCSCPTNDTVPGTVLDPFGGSGTTGLVASRLKRNAVLIELNPEYVRMAERRVNNRIGEPVKATKPKMGLPSMFKGERA